MQAKTAATLYDPVRAARLMRESEIDLMIASTRANVAYLTDSFSVLYWEYPDVAHCLEVEDDGCGAPFYFAGLPQDATAATPFAVAHANRPYVFGGDVRCVRDVRVWCERGGEQRADVLAGAIRQRKLDRATIGVEMNHLPASLLEALRTRLPHARFIDGRDVLSRIRAVKTPRELERQHQAYGIAEDVYREVLSVVQRRAGDVTVGELRAIQMAMATRAGCPPLHFGYVFPQSPPAKRAWDMSLDWKSVTVDPGDALLLDLGLIWRGYTTDFGRNAVVGPASGQIRDAYARVVECREQIAQNLRPGVAVRDAVAAARAVREHLSLPPRESFGHSLGIECHEHPILSAYADGVLEQGMTIVIELVDYAGDVAFLLEDAGLITPRGWESMTRMGTELVEL